MDSFQDFCDRQLDRVIKATNTETETERERRLAARRVRQKPADEIELTHHVGIGGYMGTKAPALS